MYEKHFRVWMKSKHNRRGLARSLFAVYRDVVHL